MPRFFVLTFLAFVSLFPMQGRAQTVIGGVRASLKESAALGTVVLSYRAKFVCSAFVVDEDLILTAGHCVFDGVLPGLTAVFSNDMSDKKAARRAIVGFELHPQYSQQGTSPGKRDRYDIALLKFEGGAPKGYQKAKLLAPNVPLERGQQALVAGYGADQAVDGHTGILHRAWVQVGDPEYAATELLIDQTSGVGACFGDSGSPAFLVIKGKLFAFALTNRAADERDCLGASVYARISAHRSWLIEAAAKLRNP